MEILKTFDLTKVFRDKKVNLQNFVAVATDALNFSRLYSSLLSFTSAKNVELYAEVDDFLQLHICAQNSNETSQNLNLYASDKCVIRDMVKNAVAAFENDYVNYLRQISRDENVHLNCSFSNVVKQLKKIEDETLAVGPEAIELPKIDHSLFANVLFEAPTKGLGTAEILDFNSFSIFITADPLDGRKFEKIRVSFTQEQLNKILDYHYRGCKLHGQYEVVKVGSKYHLVNFEVNSPTVI